MLESNVGSCIHDLIEAQAKRTPGRMALQFAGEQVTFADLSAYSNGVAHQLRELDVGPEVFVGVSMERSIDAVIGLLGTLKAGGAYIYLDPVYPAQRLRAMVDDCKPAVVMDRIIRKARFEWVDVGVTLDDAAYLIYTSGSTGNPKGTIEIHRSLTARLSAAPLPDIQETDVCVLNSSLSFGISASRLFLPLVIGVPVVILPDQEVRDIGRFVEALERHAVTSVFMVPALLRQVLAMGTASARCLQRIRAVTVSGGALTPDLVDAYFRVFPRALLINNYGSSEIGTSASSKVYTKQTDARRITIGRPMANTRISILDREMNPVPVGEAGELFVSAPHLARGYLNLPELTAECFLQDRGDGRLYRTGDLGRCLEDGEIEFLGRLDQQVKIRGFRVELGEIERVLEAHQDIREAAVTTRDADGDKRLIAYFSLRRGAALNKTRIREFLALRLPRYMIPSHLFLLDDLPHTNAGKIDRGALPLKTPGRTPIQVSDQRGTSIENVLAEIWRELLGFQGIESQDTFLDLGGDSLQATQVISKIETLFGFRVSIESLFDSTLSQIADEIAAGSPEE
jgi:amino acid adenylation domain-containing protein